VAEKSAIDLFREGPASAKAPPEIGKIIAIFGCERQHRMYMLGETGISSGVFADQIDPNRLNPAIPKIVQKVELEFGATTEFVRQTVGMAMTLFKDGIHLPEGFDRESAFLEAFSVAQDLSEVLDTVRELTVSEKETRKKLQQGMLDMGKLPKTQNLRGRANQSIAHLGRIRTATVRLAQMFYPKQHSNEGWSQALRREFERIFPDGGERSDGLMESIDYLRAVGDWRNAVEHPKQGQRVTFEDYELSAQGNLVAPTIEVDHAENPLERQDLIRFLEQSVVSLANAFETLISICCDENVRQVMDAFTTRLAKLPDDELVFGSGYVWHSEWNEGFPKIPKP
jgi:hypothetical protein